MSKDVYQLVEENYSIEKEIRKIHEVLTQDAFFYYTRKSEDGDKSVAKFRFFDFAERALYEFLPNCDTSLSLPEFMARGEAILEFDENDNLSYRRIRNYLQVVEALFRAYNANVKYFKKKGFGMYSTVYNKVVFLIKQLKKHLKRR